MEFYSRWWIPTADSLFLLYFAAATHLRERDLREPLRERDLRDLCLGASACLERRRAPPENEPFLDLRDPRDLDLRDFPILALFAGIYIDLVKNK